MIADKLQKLQTIKDNIKTAINNKGGNVGDDFTQYSTAIDNLSTGDGETGDCTLESITITENGTYEGAYDKVTVLIDDRYEEGVEDGINTQKSKLSSISITKNGTYTNENGYNSINVNVEGGGTTPIEVFKVPDEMKFKESTFTTIPEGLDFSNVTDFTETFMNCENLKSVNINTSNAIKFESTFSNCTNLETVGELDCSKLAYINGTVFSNCVNLINLGGFKNIGKSLVGSSFISFARSNGINRESMLNVFEKLYPIDELYQPKRIVITDVVKNGLRDEDIAIATSKRWVIEVV